MHRQATLLLGLLLAGLLFLGSRHAAAAQDSKLERLKCNHPGLVVDLGAGLWAWPLPMDVNSEGRMDMVINEEDVPYNGVCVYENSGSKEKMPIFKPGRRLSDGMINAQVTFVDGKPRVLTPGKEYTDFVHSGLARPVALPLAANVHPNKVRGNMWRDVDFDGDGLTDLVIGIDDWTDYGEPWTGYNAYYRSGKWLVLQHNTSNVEDNSRPQAKSDTLGAVLMPTSLKLVAAQKSQAPQESEQEIKDLQRQVAYCTRMAEAIARSGKPEFDELYKNGEVKIIPANFEEHPEILNLAPEYRKKHILIIPTHKPADGEQSQVFYKVYIQENCMLNLSLSLFLVTATLEQVRIAKNPSMNVGDFANVVHKTLFDVVKCYQDPKSGAAQKMVEELSTIDKEFQDPEIQNNRGIGQIRRLCSTDMFKKLASQPTSENSNWDSFKQKLGVYYTATKEILPQHPIEVSPQTLREREEENSLLAKTAEIIAEYAYKDFSKVEPWLSKIVIVDDMAKVVEDNHLDSAFNVKYILLLRKPGAIQRNNSVYEAYISRSAIDSLEKSQKNGGSLIDRLGNVEFFVLSALENIRVDRQRWETPGNVDRIIVSLPAAVKTVNSNLKNNKIISNIALELETLKKQLPSELCPQTVKALTDYIDMFRLRDKGSNGMPQERVQQLNERWLRFKADLSKNQAENRAGRAQSTTVSIGTAK